DAIEVAAGTYAEHMLIKQLTITGAGEEQIIIAATTGHKDVVTVLVDGTVVPPRSARELAFRVKIAQRAQRRVDCSGSQQVGAMPQQVIDHLSRCYVERDLVGGADHVPRLERRTRRGQRRGHPITEPRCGA